MTSMILFIWFSSFSSGHVFSISLLVSSCIPVFQQCLCIQSPEDFLSLPTLLATTLIFIALCSIYTITKFVYLAQISEFLYEIQNLISNLNIQCSSQGLVNISKLIGQKSNSLFSDPDKTLKLHRLFSISVNGHAIFLAKLAHVWLLITF